MSALPTPPCATRCTASGASPDFRPLQREAMQAVLDAARQRRRAADRRRQVALLPGAGARGCAARVVAPRDARRPRRGFALVVSPLISLMKDQVDGLRVDGVDAAYLNSTLGAGERDAVMASLREDRCRLLYVSPERLVGEGSQGFRRFLQQCGVRVSWPSTRRTASASGATTSGRSTASSGGCARTFPGVSLHAFTATATERVRRDIVDELRLRRSARAGRLVRPAEPDLPRAASRQPAQAAPAGAGPPRGRSRHRLLLVAPRGRVARRVAAGRRASARCPITPACPTRSAAGTRTSSSTSASTSSSRRSRSAWASIGRTCGSSCTPGRRARRSTTSRSRAAPDATGCRPSAC